MNKITTAWSSMMGAAVLFALFGSACQKTPLPPDVTEPTVFSVKSLDSSITLTAGLKEVYLYTDFGRDTNDVLVFSGTFARVGCQPVGACPGSVRFEFRSVKKGSEVLPGEAFHEGEFEYAEQSGGQIETIYRTTFTAVDTAGFGNFIWNFDTTDTAEGRVVQRNFFSPKPVKVDLASFDTNQTQSTLVRRTVSISGQEQFPAVQIRIEPDSANNLIQATTTGAPVVKYAWFPDVTQKDSQYFEPFLDGQYAVTVTADDGTTASSQANETADLNKVFVTPSFVYSVQPITLGDSLQLGRVAIQWVDLQGFVWRSDWGKQNADSQFIVTSTKPYDPNEKGQSTRKMEVLFRCFLYTQSGEMQAFEGTAVIAVAY